MKLITLIALTLMFIGCASEDPEVPLPGTGGGINQGPPVIPPPPPGPVVELETGTSSQTILTCSKEGADDIVYVAKTYETPRACQHSQAEGKACLCEVGSTHGNFENQNGIYLYATSTGDWCEGSAIDSIENNLGVTVYGTGTETEFVSAAHDASYTCSRS